MGIWALGKLWFKIFKFRGWCFRISQKYWQNVFEIIKSNFINTESEVNNFLVINYAILSMLLAMILFIIVKFIHWQTSIVVIKTEWLNLHSTQPKTLFSSMGCVSFSSIVIIAWMINYVLVDRLSPMLFQQLKLVVSNWLKLISLYL